MAKGTEGTEKPYKMTVKELRSLKYRTLRVSTA
jgi:hypothetical protein